MEFAKDYSAKSPKFRSARAILALILREMESTYGRSVGGYLWVILEPAAGIAIMSLIFGLILQAPPLGTSFPFFFATGILPFLFYTTVSTKIGQAIRFSRPLLAYPALNVADAVLARFLLNSTSQIVVMVIVLVGITGFQNLQLAIDWPELFIALAMLVSLTGAIGVLTCFLGSAFPVWTQIWAVLSRPLFILSGVLFLPENVPIAYREVFLLNPLAHVISQFRSAFYPTYHAQNVDPIYVFLLSLCIGTFGLFLLLRNSHWVLQR
ncbi:MAG: ABC transporter permease [Paracoccaceae bacterium]